MDQIIESLARSITMDKLTAFYSDPATQAEFEAWREKRKKEEKPKNIGVLAENKKEGRLAPNPQT